LDICGSPSADLFYSAATAKKAKIRLAKTQPGQAGLIKFKKLKLIPVFVSACLFVPYKDANKWFAQFAQN
jgi:hypothetical protein